MFEKILVPLDGSKRGETILPYVEEMARMRRTTILFLQVVEPVSGAIPPYDVTLYLRVELVEQMLAEAQERLAALASEFRERGFAADSLVEQGPIVRTILDVAKREQVALIAMASHGRTGLARVFYGSVTAGVLQQVDRPLLLIRASNEE
jgi:nucleotide-binding universal stress UspA family protein